MSQRDIDRMIDDGCPNHQDPPRVEDNHVPHHTHHAHHSKLHLPSKAAVRRFKREHKNLIHGAMIAAVIAAIAIEGPTAKDLAFLALSIVVEVA